MDEVRFTKHALEKIEKLQTRGLPVTREWVIQAISTPDSVKRDKNDILIAQRCLNEKLLIRVVYRELAAFVLAITVYPGRRSRYEKN